MSTDPVTALLEAEAILRKAALQDKHEWGDEDPENGVHSDSSALLGDVWQQSANTFHPGNASQNTETLPPGVYVFRSTIAGWYLEKTSNCFEFPYKIYGNNDHIVNRIQKAWKNISSSLGVLLNGVKGTGKTVTVQLIGNWAIANNMPVLLVEGPMPLGTVLSKINQDIVVIFDEFEKTHAKPEHQQALLTTLDGMGRSKHKRLFLLTTNNKSVENNFIDRPSRIRYCWEFERLSDDVIEEIMDDILRPDLTHLRGPIVTYLNTRRVLSIDVVKTVINEVNIFEEAPSEFGNIMNLTEMTPKGFTLEILNDDGSVSKVLTSYFTLDKTYTMILQQLLTKSGSKEYVEDFLEYGQAHHFIDRNVFRSIIPRESTDDPTVWACEVRIPAHDTWLQKFPRVRNMAYDKGLWLDEKPRDWKIPRWAQKYEKDVELSEEEEEEMNYWLDSCTVYGGNVRKLLKIRIEPNYTSLTNDNWDKDTF